MSVRGLSEQIKMPEYHRVCGNSEQVVMPEVHRRELIACGVWTIICIMMCIFFVTALVVYKPKANVAEPVTFTDYDGMEWPVYVQEQLVNITDRSGPPVEFENWSEEAMLQFISVKDGIFAASKRYASGSRVIDDDKRIIVENGDIWFFIAVDAGRRDRRMERYEGRLWAGMQLDANEYEAIITSFR